MGSLSDYLELEVLDHILGNAAFTAPATVYVSLSTADPTDDASGNAEPSGNGYARSTVANNATNWPAAAAGAKANGTAVQFAQATGSWGTVTHFAIWDALTTGNMLMHGSLGASLAITSGMAANFPIGDIDVTLD